MKQIILTLGICCVIFCAHAGELTHISAEITGFAGKEISFDFVEEPAQNMKFPYIENQLIEFDVELSDITMLKINGWVAVCLQPGDSIHAKIVYKGSVYNTVEYSGSLAAVSASALLHRIRELRREKRYKMSVPSALLMKLPVNDYFESTLKEWQEELGLLENIKGQLSENLYNYLKSEIEGVLLPNALIYPYAYVDVTKKDLQENLPQGYWEVLDHYRLREDKGSLRNRLYLSFLTPYKAYMKSKNAGTILIDYAPIKDTGKEYRDIVAYYEGDLRDAALFSLLYNAIMSSRDLESVEKLMKEYQKKYNLNKTYKSILDELMK